MMISLVAAMGRNLVIGDGERLPWHLPRDLQRFKALTTGKPIIMGRKTFASIGRPLPGRHNIVLTRDPSFTASGVTVARGVDDALKAAGDVPEVMVVGGGEVYRLFLDLATRAYITIVEGEFEGSATFPWAEMMRHEWRTISEELSPADEKNPHADRYLILERQGAACGANPPSTA